MCRGSPEVERLFEEQRDGGSNPSLGTKLEVQMSWKIVSQEAFDAVKCNRCGKCCEDCKHLSFLGSGQTACVIYAQRCSACRDFPEDNWSLAARLRGCIPPECSWHPKRLAEQGIVVKEEENA